MGITSRCFCFRSSSATTQLLELPTGTNGQMRPALDLKRYSSADMKRMTRNFNPDAVIGGGGRGAVYKGWIDAETMAPSMHGFGLTVAVKKTRRSARSYNIQDMVLESEYLCRVPHPNVIKLLGYCLEDKETILVYEFMQKGTLEMHLFNVDFSSTSFICWGTRLRIAIGVARGLTFLHSSQIPIVHEYLSPSNILLDGSYNPKISGSRLSTSWFSPTDPLGCNETVWLKNNVYSFGVVLLEILAGLRAHESQHVDGEKNLVVWATLLSDRTNLETIMDARLDGHYSKDAAFKAAQLALRCTRKEPQTRPTMKEVLHDLERIERM